MHLALITYCIFVFLGVQGSKFKIVDKLAGMNCPKVPVPAPSPTPTPRPTPLLTLMPTLTILPLTVSTPCNEAILERAWVVAAREGSRESDAHARNAAKQTANEASAMCAQVRMLAESAADLSNKIAIGASSTRDTSNAQHLKVMAAVRMDYTARKVTATLPLQDVSKLAARLAEVKAIVPDVEAQVTLLADESGAALGAGRPPSNLICDRLNAHARELDEPQREQNMRLWKDCMQLFLPEPLKAAMARGKVSSAQEDRDAMEPADEKERRTVWGAALMACTCNNLC